MKAIIRLLALVLLSVLLFESCPRRRTIQVGEMSQERPVVVYTKDGPQTHSNVHVPLSAHRDDGRVVQATAHGYRLLPDIGLFTEVEHSRVEHSEVQPVLVQMGDTLWVIQRASDYRLFITPAMKLPPEASAGVSSFRRALKAKLSKIPDNIGTIGVVDLPQLIDSSLLDNSGQAFATVPKPLINVRMDKSQIALDLQCEKTLPIRMTFDHRFDLLKLERDGKELPFDRTVWNQVHETWLESIAGRLKENQQFK